MNQSGEVWVALPLITQSAFIPPSFYLIISSPLLPPFVPKEVYEIWKCVLRLCAKAISSLLLKCPPVLYVKFSYLPFAAAFMFCALRRVLQFQRKG